MMRKPKLDEVPPIETTQSGFITQVREYELITPLFGGGVIPGQVDPLTPVRGTEIRGHLRFWWRATCGGRFDGDLEKMKAAEDKLWGAASTAEKIAVSQVQVAVKVTSEGKEDSPFEVINKNGKPQIKARDGSVVPPYAAFPLQPAQQDARIGMQTKSVRVGITFILRLSFPASARKEVEAALWAWETFGGIGARTRRGFGALHCLKVDNRAVSLPRFGQVEQQIREGLAKYITEGKWPENVPHLNKTMGPNLKVTRVDTNANKIWRQLVKKLQDFRQTRDGSKYGPSLWPESNAIRSLTQNRVAGERPLIKKFPRGRFGLPIIFHFAHKGEPNDTTLKGIDDIERLASPLILRPLVCADGAVGVALILQTPIEPPGGLMLTEKDTKRSFSVSASLNSGEAKQISPLQGKTDILMAFLDTI